MNMKEFAEDVISNRPQKTSYSVFVTSDELQPFLDALINRSAPAPSNINIRSVIGRDGKANHYIDFDIEHKPEGYREFRTD